MVEQVEQQHGQRGIVLTACMLATFMAAVEVTIVSTAMPTIIGDLGGFSLLGWVFAAYLLTQAISTGVWPISTVAKACFTLAHRCFCWGRCYVVLPTTCCG